jgi:type IV pilus assembly protein PilP
MTRSTPTLLLLGALALTGCVGNDRKDLEEFVRSAGENKRGRVDPLPQMKTFDLITYEAFDLPDPFQPRKIEPDKAAAAALPEDFKIRTGRAVREPLEAYPLESLKMVGTLERGKARWALIKTPDSNLYRVTSGNYMGQNFGVIAMISDTAITLKELIQDTTGSWSERTSQLQLQDEEEKK